MRFEDPPTLILPLDSGVAVFSCPVGGACAGGGPTTNCSAGYTGALCGACAEKYGRRSNGNCVLCHGGTSYTQNLLEIAFVFGVVIAGILLWTNRRRLSQLFRLVLDAELVEHTKIVIGFFQVVSPLPNVLSIHLADQLPLLSVIIKAADPIFLSLDDFVHLHCLPGFNRFYPNWIINTFAVPGVILVAVGLNYLRDRTQAQGARTMAFSVGFLIYPRVTKHIFEMLNCRSLAEGEKWLEQDYSVECGGGLYNFFFFFSVLLVVVIPLGVPLSLLMVLLRRTRRNYNNFDHDSGRDFWQANYDDIFNSYEMVVRVYRKEVCFYEAVDWLRKMLLGGLLMLLHRGSVFQVFAGTCISFGFFGLHMELRPYKKPATNCLKACVEIQVFLTMFISDQLRFSDRLGGELVDFSGYQWMLVTTFTAFVPGAFVVCSIATLRMSRRERSEQTTLETPLLQFSTDGVGSG